MIIQMSESCFYFFSGPACLKMLQNPLEIICLKHSCLEVG